ncbi:hypothetical protein [Caldibacillus debilis]|uniref:hypothetical protein n=1 Tax=Caldibacillus debilis TaxID=301148 RepID=UPI0015FF9A34|nr:hypothetical protein [Caldibacillus debilis]
MLDFLAGSYTFDSHPSEGGEKIAGKSILSALPDIQVGAIRQKKKGNFILNLLIAVFFY